MEFEGGSVKPILTSEQHDSYKRDGFLVLENFFDPSELEILRADFNGVVDDWANTYYQQGRLTDLFADQSFEHRLFSIHQAMTGDCHELLTAISGKRKTAAMFYVMTLPEILDLVGFLIGPEILAHPQFNARAKLPDRTSVVPWHQDLGYLHKSAEETFMVNLWLPLVDANAENGCLEVIRGSHNCGILPYNSGGAEDLVPESIPEGEVVCCPLQVGGVLMLQHKTVHRSTPNFSDHIRWSLDIRYSDPALPTGRDHVPGFLVRSVSQPNRVAKDHHDWLKLFAENGD